MSKEVGKGEETGLCERVLDWNSVLCGWRTQPTCNNPKGGSCEEVETQFYLSISCCCFPLASPIRNKRARKPSDVIQTGQYPRVEKGNKCIWRGKWKIFSYFTGTKTCTRLEPTHHHNQGNRQIHHCQKSSHVSLCFICFIEIRLKMRSTLLKFKCIV